MGDGIDGLRSSRYHWTLFFLCCVSRQLAFAVSFLLKVPPFHCDGVMKRRRFELFNHR